jgi:FkbM family methyltransferase
MVIAATNAAPGSGVRRELASAMRGIMKVWRREPVDIEAYGLKLRLHHQENLADKRVLFYPRFWDIEEREILSSLIVPNFRFLDIGANTGLYSLFVASRAGAGATIVSVEPQPQVKDWFAFNIAANGFTTIHHVDAAIAAGPGTALLTLPTRNRGAASITRAIEPKHWRASQTIEVPTLGILDLMDRFGMQRADVMKIDIEGAEDMALEPFFAACTKERLPRHIFMERNSTLWRIDCVALVKRAGYVEKTETARHNVVFALAS